MMMKKTKSLLLTMLIVGSANVFSMAQSCLSGYQYRTPIVLSNSISELTSYQLLVTLNTSDLVTANKMDATGKDIRVLNRKGVEQSYWIVDGTMNTTTTQIWIKADTIRGTNTDTLFFFYGNPGAVAKSNPSATFDIYDDFDGSALSANWSTCGTGSESVALGMLNASVNGDTIRFNNNIKLKSSIIVELLVGNLSSGDLSFGVVNKNGYGYASFIDTAQRQVVQIDSGFCYSADSLNSKTSTSAAGLSSFTWVATGVQSADDVSGSVIATNSTHVLPDTVSTFIALSDTGNVVIDFFRVRKYASAVPTTKFLSEVNMNYTLTQSYAAASFCEGDTLRLGVNDVNGARYAWSGPNGFKASTRLVTIPKVTALNSGQYDVSVSIPAGCANKTSSVVMNVSSTTKGGLVTGFSPVCEGTDSVILSLINHVGAIQLWESADTTIGPWLNETGVGSSLKVLKPTSSKYYRAVIKSGSCLFENSTSYHLVVDKKSDGGTTSSINEVCAGINSGNVELSNFLGKIIRWESKNASQANWSQLDTTNSTLPFNNIIDTTQFKAFVKNGVCPEVESSIAIVNVNPIPTVNINHGTLCEGVIVSFEEAVNISDGTISSYSWLFSDGFTSTQTKFNKSFGANGTYNLTLNVVSDKGCKASLNRSLVVGESPNVLFDVLQGLSPNTGCLNQTLLLNNKTKYSDISALKFNWNFGNGLKSNAVNPTTSYKQSGNFTISLIATTPLGCVDSFNKQFTVFKSNKPIAGPDLKASKGIDLQLNAIGSSSYQWTPANVLNNANIANPIANVLQNTMFVVTGTDYYGCTSKDTVLVTVEEDYAVIPNNVITPDGNGSNDVWEIQNLENYPDNQVWVFDRWGQEVFSATAYNNMWNATDSNGNQLLDGTYYYVIEFKEVGKTLKGAITIINNL